MIIDKKSYYFQKKITKKTESKTNFLVLMYIIKTDIYRFYCVGREGFLSFYPPCSMLHAPCSMPVLNSESIIIASKKGQRT